MTMSAQPQTPRPKVSYKVKNPSKDFRPVAPRKGAVARFLAPRRFDATWSNLAGLGVVLTVKLGDDGVPYCAGLAIQQTDPGQSITGQTLRDISLPQLMQAALDEVTFKAERQAGGGWRMDFPPVSRSRTPITGEHLQEVARRYKAALERDEPPTYTVAREMGVSRATAARWVGLARDAKHLGPALPGRPGEGKS
jgi:hypothetical protein